MTIRFFFYMLALCVAPAVVVGLVLVVINSFWDNRKYLELEEEVYEGQKVEPGMPEEPYK
jgi:hypothetical protein